MILTTAEPTAGVGKMAKLMDTACAPGQRGRESTRAPGTSASRSPASTRGPGRRLSGGAAAGAVQAAEAEKWQAGLGEGSILSVVKVMHVKIPFLGGVHLLCTL